MRIVMHWHEVWNYLLTEMIQIWLINCIKLTRFASITWIVKDIVNQKKTIKIVSAKWNEHATFKCFDTINLILKP